MRGGTRGEKLSVEESEGKGCIWLLMDKQEKEEEI